MNDTTKKIVAEAVEKYFATPVSAKGQRADLLSIIQSAIEKAVESLDTDLVLAKQMVVIESKRANLAESRAAHASEQGAERKALELILARCQHGRPTQYAFTDIIHWCEEALSQRPTPATASEPEIVRALDDQGRPIGHTVRKHEPAHASEPWTPQMLSRLFDAECSPEDAIERICSLHNNATAHANEVCTCDNSASDVITDPYCPIHGQLRAAHASEKGDSEWECPDCHTRKSDLRLADATSQALRHQLLQSRPAHEEPWDLLAEAMETLNPATSLYKDIKHALSQRPTPATTSEPCVYKGDCGLCERCGKPMSDYKHTRAAHASEPVYHSCKLGECGVKLEPDIVAEAAETQVRSLEERGYLDFDSGEQEDRASVVAQLAAIIQSSIEKVRLESRDEIEELQRQLRIAHKWALLSDDISEDDATLQDTKRLDWLDDGHLSYINYNINGVMRTIPDPQGQGSARRSIDAAMEQA